MLAWAVQIIEPGGPLGLDRCCASGMPGYCWIALSGGFRRSTAGLYTSAVVPSLGLDLARA